MTRILPLFALFTVACGEPTDSAELFVGGAHQGRPVVQDTLPMVLSIVDADGPVLGAMVCDEVTCVSAPNGEVTLHLPAGEPAEIQIVDWNHVPTVVHWESPAQDGSITVELLTEPAAASWNGALHELVVSDGAPAQVELQADDLGELVEVRFAG